MTDVFGPVKTDVLIFMVSAHCPGFGVKVYVADALLLIIGGFQVPVIPLTDVLGKTGIEAPSQKGGIGLKKGAILGMTVTSKVVLTAH